MKILWFLYRMGPGSSRCWPIWRNAIIHGGKELVRSYEKSIILATIDQSWQEHLRELDDLRQSVRNAQYEQKDPLLIYKFEAFELFTAMIDKVNKDVVSTLMKAHIPLKDPNSVKRAEAPRKMDLSKFEANKDEMTSYNDPSGGGQSQRRSYRRLISRYGWKRRLGEMIPVPVEVERNTKTVTEDRVDEYQANPPEAGRPGGQSPGTGRS